MSEFENTVTQTSRQRGPWLFAPVMALQGVVGAALYGILGIFSYTLPGMGDIVIRPAIAIVAFFGVRFGPWVGYATGFLGNCLIDWLNGDGVLTDWNWSIAVGLIGLIAGFLGFIVRVPAGERAQLVRVAAIGAVAVIFALLFTVTDVLRGTAVGEWWLHSYLPAMAWSGLVALLLTPLLASGWRGRERSGTATT